MIGSKRKVLSVYAALEREGIPNERFDHIHAPVGLEIGALTPDEIAISIAAELIAVRRGAHNNAHMAVERARYAHESTR
jgi:xanthine dehydrogenase accessory factor